MPQVLDELRQAQNNEAWQVPDGVAGIVAECVEELGRLGLVVPPSSDDTKLLFSDEGKKHVSVGIQFKSTESVTEAIEGEDIKDHNVWSLAKRLNDDGWLNRFIGRGQRPPAYDPATDYPLLHWYTRCNAARLSRN